MSATTIFLGVLILSLFLGNVLLFFIGRKTHMQKIAQAVYGSSAARIAQPSVVSYDYSATSQNPGLVPLENKVELAHRRIQELESQLRASKSPGGFSTDELMKRKIERLDSFRSIAESELIGIKEILAEIQNSNITVKSRTYKKPAKGKEIPVDKMRKMIYRSSS
ncbi:MAG TPA: hypothetical protein VJH23_01240 [archaeon]|nr:hypothetical protein [archaeon]